MKTVVKVLAIGLLGLLASAVLLCLFLVVYNLRDEALDADVAKLLDAAPTQIAAAENGYFAWIGVAGPETQPPHSWGRRWFDEALASDESAGDAEDPAPLAIDSEKRNETFAAKDLFCDKPETCLEAVAAAPSNARALLAKASTTLERTDAALSFPAYQEAWRPDFNFKSFFPHYPGFWRQLTSTRFALAVADHRHDEALEHLGREMAFHVRQMQGAVTLIEKVVAIASLRNDYQLLNRYLLLQPAAARQRADRIAALLAPLPAEALRMSLVMETECRTGLRLFLSLKDEAVRKRSAKQSALLPGLREPVADFLAMPLYLPNATANEFYRIYRPILAVDGQSGDAYRQALEATAQRAVETTGLADLAVHNPIGHILVVIGTPAFGSYYLKRDDLLVLRAAVSLQLDLLRRGVHDEEAVGRALREAGLVHPFSGETPTWNGPGRTLTYQAQAGRKNQALAIAF
jgi:hypothetical protein